jgi:hypothetical protein
VHRNSIDGCTVVARNYAAHARVLAESFLDAHPGSSFTILVVDDPRCEVAVAAGSRSLTPADIGVEEAELARRATMYTAQGLVASLKPVLLQWLLAHSGRPVVLLDADGIVHGSLHEVAQLAERHSLVLSPHTLEPHPLWELDSPEQIILRAGIMNAGLIAVGERAEPFLSWWGERTSRRCVFDAAHGLVQGQAWLTLATSLFEHHILRDPGCNVAGWNLQSREVDWTGPAPAIAGVPLRHFHFAGAYDPQHPEWLSRSEHARWWPSLEARPGLLRLSHDYAERLLAHGYLSAHKAVPRFDHTPGGVLIEPWMREAFRRSLIAAELHGTAEPPNPFANGDERFVRWLDDQVREHVQAHPPDESGREPEEMARALREGQRLLSRIEELDAARDEAIAWAQRVSAELEITKGLIADQAEQLHALYEARPPRRLRLRRPAGR